jgi:GT2 family glycosyltransferase
MEPKKPVAGMRKPRVQNPAPFVSVISVTWNSAAYLSRCLNALAVQTFKDFEVVLVDNGSTDGSLDEVESRWPGLTLRVERLDENRGFAAANNLGVRLARGEWLALLNSDAFPDQNWLEQLLLAAENNPEFTFFASRQIQANAPHLLDGAGDALHISGLAWRCCAVSRPPNSDWNPKRCSAPALRLRCIRTGRSCRWAGLTRIFLVTMRT